MSRTKLALLTAATMLSALASGSCLLGNNWYHRVLQYVAIGSIFD